MCLQPLPILSNMAILEYIDSIRYRQARAGWVLPGGPAGSGIWLSGPIPGAEVGAGTGTCLVKNTDAIETAKGGHPLAQNNILKIYKNYS